MQPDHPRQGDSYLDDNDELWIFDGGDWIDADTFYGNPSPEEYPPMIYRPE